LEESLLKWALLLGPLPPPPLTLGLVTMPLRLRRPASGDRVGSLTPDPDTELTPDPDPTDTDPPDPLRLKTTRVGESTSGMRGGRAGAVGLVIGLAGGGGGGLDTLEWGGCWWW
jgi:hypothetical protein